MGEEISMFFIMIWSLPLYLTWLQTSLAGYVCYVYVHDVYLLPYIFITLLLKKKHNTGIDHIRSIVWLFLNNILYFSFICF